LSCQAHITYAQNRDIGVKERSEVETFAVVAEPFRTSDCGLRCNPPPRQDVSYGCRECTASVLADGITRGEQIDFLKSTMGEDELKACSQVSAVEFQNVCHPECNPSLRGTSGGLGPHVKVFSPTMEISYIQKAFDELLAKQVNNEMGTGRFAMLFMPVEYGTALQPLQLV
jgi:hypothetical protein